MKDETKITEMVMTALASQPKKAAPNGRQMLIVKLSDMMDPENARRLVDDCLADELRTVTAQRDELLDQLRGLGYVGTTDSECLARSPEGYVCRFEAGHTGPHSALADPIEWTYAASEQRTELLIALKALADDYERVCGDGIELSPPLVLTIARAVIAKVEGQ